jgi:autotransporter-associated beta strand protein
LTDSVGGSNATIMDVGANNATLGTTQVTLTGGTKTTSDYVRLGSNLLPNTATPVTIELWATQISAKNWSRIFDCGTDSTENLFMSWTRGTTATQDRVGWNDNSSETNVDDTNQPYTLNTEYHIVLELNPVGSSTVVKWYSAPSGNANLGSVQGTFTKNISLANLIDTEDNLGRSFWGDDTANASYNEVRFWNSALDMNILEKLHDAGPDANLSSLNLGSTGSLPSTTAVNLSGSGATLDLNGLDQTVGSLSGVAGSTILLGTGTLTIGGNGTSTAFSGTISGVGGIIKTGAGTFTLAGANTYTGPTSVAGGVLELQNASALGASTVGASVENGASLSISQSLNIGNVSLSLKGDGAGNGALHIGGGSLVNYGGAINLADNASIKADANSTLNLTNPSGISGANNSLTFTTENGATAVVSGTLDLGTGSLIKNSSGTLIIAGNILSVGSTSIADGSLQINSTSAAMHDISGDGVLIVGDGTTAASLSADSIIIGTVTLAAGARITINPIPGGPQSGPLQPVPEPSSICLLILAGSMLLAARFKKIV